ncbi:MAG: dehydrogenase [Hyphomicrobiales bacterium]|nr:MAG: dehydrogenase [Hyphomicrobiales bacterium]
MKLNRRDLIKTTAAAGGIAATAAMVPDARAAATAAAGPTPQPASPGKGNWVPTVCQGCTSWCAAEALVQDGRVVNVRGNHLSKSNHGYLCPRGLLGIGQMYDPDRVKVPMKRTNPKKGRGIDPKFVPISWDEALDAVADKMMELRKNNETEKFMLMRGRYTYCRDVIYDALPKIFGSPNNISHSAICAEAEKFGAYYTEGFWDYRDYDLENTKYVICFGGDPIASNRQVPNAIRQWGKVLDQATVVAIDPRLTATASKAHEWLPVKPGEDSALAVAMAHVILTEGLWSREFVGDFTDGVNAFKPGAMVDEAAFVENHTSGLVKWWNIELKDRTPEWAEKVCLIPADQIRRVATGFAKAAPHVMVWMAPGAAMQPRGAYGGMAAHALNGLVGAVDNKGGTLQKMSAKYTHIPLLKEKFKPYVDDIAKKGLKHKKIDQRGTLEFPALKKKPGGGVVTNRAADGILDENPNEIKVAIGYWNNFPFSATGAGRWERALAKLPFFVHITTNPAEMSQFADIVLPASFHMFERWGLLPSKYNRYSYIGLQQPVVKPLWDSRIDETEVVWMLARKLKDKGFANLFDYFQTEMKDPETGKPAENEAEFAQITVKIMTEKQWNPKKYHSGEKIDGWQQFVKMGLWQSDPYPFKKLWKKGFKTKTHKFEFYSETLKSVLGKHAEKHEVSIDKVMEVTQYAGRGEQVFVPHWEPAKYHGEEKDYPYIFMDSRSRLSREGRSQNLPAYYEFKKCDPGDTSHKDVLKINPKDAEALGVKTGDWVKVTSPEAEVKAEVKLWEGIRPGTVNKTYGMGHWAYGRVAAEDFSKHIPRGFNNNELLPADYDRLSGATARHAVTRVRIEKV